MFNPLGISIAFLGPDGSGKSTIINEILNYKGLPFRRKFYFHLKPIKIKNIDKKSIIKNPHKYPPYSQFKSYLKLVYFVFQYNIGWIINILPLKSNSNLVIFDRFYDDLLVDFKRYRYGGSIKVAKWIGKFIPKPDIYFILTANSKVIFKRKKEVSFTELERQIREYRVFADDKRYFNIAIDRPPVEITNEILKIILQKLNEKN